MNGTELTDREQAQVNAIQHTYAGLGDTEVARKRAFWERMHLERGIGWLGLLALRAECARRQITTAAVEAHHPPDWMPPDRSKRLTAGTLTPEVQKLVNQVVGRRFDGGP